MITSFTSTVMRPHYVKDKTENLHNPGFGSSCFRFCKTRVYGYSVEPLPWAPFGDKCLLRWMARRPTSIKRQRYIPGTVKLWESPDTAGGLPWIKLRDIPELRWFFLENVNIALQGNCSTTIYLQHLQICADETTKLHQKVCSNRFSSINNRGCYDKSSVLTKHW